MDQPNKPGAPKGNRNAAKDDARDSVVRFRCQRPQKGRWVAAARAQGKTLTDWITTQLNAASR